MSDTSEPNTYQQKPQGLVRGFDFSQSSNAKLKTARKKIEILEEVIELLNRQNKVLSDLIDTDREHFIRIINLNADLPDHEDEARNYTPEGDRGEQNGRE